MTYKINPGCEMPDIPLPPSVEQFVQNLTAQALTNLVLYRIPGAGKVAYLKAKADALIASKAALAKQISDRITLIQQYQERLARILSVPCPLPPVLDSDATKRILGS